MKTLFIVRHGKSSWDLLGVSDIDRPLIVKGIANNYNIAEVLSAKYPKPDLILCSPANRATHTALIFARALGLEIDKIQFRKKIYECNSSEIIEIIEAVHSNIDNLMIIGHNPTFTDVANLFLPENIDNLPTSGVVVLQFDSGSWKIKNKTPVNTGIYFPKKE